MLRATGYYGPGPPGEENHETNSSIKCFSEESKQKAVIFWRRSFYDEDLPTAIWFAQQVGVVQTNNSSGILLTRMDGSRIRRRLQDFFARSNPPPTPPPTPLEGSWTLIDAELTTQPPTPSVLYELCKQGNVGKVRHMLNF